MSLHYPHPVRSLQISYSLQINTNLTGTVLLAMTPVMKRLAFWLQSFIKAGSFPMAAVHIYTYV